MLWCQENDLQMISGVLAHLHEVSKLVHEVAPLASSHPRPGPIVEGLQATCTQQHGRQHEELTDMLVCIAAKHVLGVTLPP